jgi:hypothetical protein
MDEISKITEKYNPDFVKEGLSSLASINRFALNFYKDVAEVYDVSAVVTTHCFWSVGYDPVSS